MSYVNAKRLQEVVTRRFEQHGISLIFDKSVIPKDNTTLFVCSGMQQLKDRFMNPDGSKYGSLQSCIRTNDLDLVGDGTHLTYFEMLGNFSFGGNDYEKSVELWNSIIRDLEIQVTYITFHPSRKDHQELWLKRGYVTKPDDQCSWTDGNIGGNCCEVFVGDLEIGNLVNPLGHSTDVGFGFERLLQVLESKTRVDDTSLFRKDLSPMVRDHYRTLKIMRENDVTPGSYGRNYICRKILRRILETEDSEKLQEFKDWLDNERQIIDKRLKTGKRLWHRYKNKPESFWKETFGLDSDDLITIRKMKESHGETI